MTTTAAVSRQLAIANPSDETRRGFVILPVAQVAGAGVVVDAVSATRNGQPVRAQLDRIDRDDRTRDVVAILLEDIPAGGYKVGNETVHLDLAFEPGPPFPSYPGDHRREDTDGVELWSSKLKLYVHLPKEPFGWQGGAITSVQLEGREVLDPVNAEYGPQNHDYEKRLQIDRVSMANPPWCDAPASEYPLFRESWSYVTSSAGPARAFTTIKSPLFKHAYDGVSFDCHLYRVISLFWDADYVHEEIYVTGTKSGQSSPSPLSFSAHFFLKVNFGVYSQITRVPQIPDWFSIGATAHPFPGFGFAASVPCGRIDNPPVDYPNYKTEHGAFGWDCGFTSVLRCIHLFRRYSSVKEVSDETGRRWFDLILNAPRGRMT